MKTAGLILIYWLISPLVFAQNVISVSPVGGDFSNPSAALEAMSTSLPPSSASNRHLVKVGPGLYNISDPVEMQPYVDLEGSGVKSTVIRGRIGSSLGTPVSLQGIINAASNSEIRDLTVRNNWSETSAVGIAVNNTTNSAITNVRSVSRGQALDSSAWKYGMFIENSSGVRLTHVVARGIANDDSLCQGISVSGSRVSISDSRMVGAGGSCTIGIGLNANMDSTVQISDGVL